MMDQINIQMDLRAEKLNIIEKLLVVNDELLLQAIKNILEVGLRQQIVQGGDEEKDFWDDLTPEQQNKIERSIKQLDDGQGIPHEEVMATFRKKLQR